MAKPSSSWFGYVLASPGTMLQYAYYVISFFVLVFLAIATGFEIRRHHLRHVVEAIALVVLMVGLVTAANVSFFAEPVLAAPQEAN
jgi:NhaP-type Na+/H+ or K+/H+ antiporter